MLLLCSLLTDSVVGFFKVFCLAFCLDWIPDAGFKPGPPAMRPVASTWVGRSNHCTTYRFYLKEPVTTLFISDGLCG